MKATSRYQNTALRLLHLYPRAWRERYADEVSAVLEERPATLRTVFDLGLGMLDAYMRHTFFTEREFSMEQRLRDSQVTIFAAFFFFAFAWLFYVLLLSRIWTYVRWSIGPLTQVNSDLALRIINFSGLCAVAATLVGAIALVAITVRQTLKKKQRSFTLFGVAWLLSSVPAFGLLYWLLRLDFVDYSSISNVLVRDIVELSPLLPAIWWLFIGPACLVLGTRKAELTPRFMRFTFVLTTVITLCMSVILGAMVYLVLGLLITAPQFHINTLYSGVGLDFTALWMALLAVLCYVSLWRGWKAQRSLKLA